MGMFTEILIKARIKPDITDTENSVLDFMFNHTDKPTQLPDHPFFIHGGWVCVGSLASYYHIPWVDSKYSHGYLFSRSDIKNYNEEIDNFFDWLRTICNNLKGECIGYRWYEEDNKPTLIFV